MQINSINIKINIILLLHVIKLLDVQWCGSLTADITIRARYFLFQKKLQMSPIDSAAYYLKFDLFKWSISATMLLFCFYANLIKKRGGGRYITAILLHDVNLERQIVSNAFLCLTDDQAQLPICPSWTWYQCGDNLIAALLHKIWRAPTSSFYRQCLLLSCELRFAGFLIFWSCCLASAQDDLVA